jgi:hypothetical protein
MDGNELRTSDWSVNLQHIALLPQDFGPFLQYPQSLILSDTTFSIKVIFEKRDIRFGTILPVFVKELLCGRFLHRWGLYLINSLVQTMKCKRKEMDAYIFDDPFLSANYRAILENMLCKVDGWNRIFDLDLVYRPLDLGTHDDCW